MLNARRLLREAGLLPKRSFGQNFLVDGNIARAIARAAVPDDEAGRAHVVELGAGLGALTSLLAERAARVDAVERDRELVPLLARALEASIASGRVHVHEADAQQVDLPALFAATRSQGAPRVLTGNLPYQITGRLLELAVRESAELDRVVFMVQREVADRLLAEPSTKAYGALTVFVRAAFDVARVAQVPPSAFHPPPDVTSSVVRLTPTRPRRAEETETFRAVVKGAFGARRKTLRNAWASLGPARVAAAAESAGVSLEARGETLDVDAFARMALALGPLSP